MDTMENNQTDRWFYAVVQNPGSSGEQLMGFNDGKTGTDFIPVFSTREEAQQCFLVMPKDVINDKYEVQAIIEDDLITISEQGRYVVYHMDHKGSIKETITK